MMRNHLIGVALLAIGRGAGMARFGDDPRAFIRSFLPAMAFPLIGSLLLLKSGSAATAVLTLIVTLVAQLAPAVISHALAVRWDREEDWLRYATAFNWCQLAIPAAAFLVLILLQTFGGDSLPDEQATTLMVVLLGLYALSLHWVLARNGLLLGRLRAALLVALVNGGTMLLILAPRWIGNLLA